MDDHPPEKKQQVTAEFSRQIAVKEQRKLKGRRQKGQDVWFGLGMFGLVGWSVTIPTLIGVALGVWIDKTWGSQYSWTLPPISREKKKEVIMVFVHSGIFDLPMAFAAGLLIGSFYFLALWLTVRRLPKARFPAVLTLVMAGCWERLLVSLLGFIVMRFILVRRFQPQKPFIPAGRTC